MMPLIFHILIFGITGLLLYLGIFFGVPKLQERGIPLIYSFFAFLWIPVLFLSPLALLFYHVFEDGPMTYVALVERFRFHPLKGRDWIWVSLGVLVTFLSDQLLEPIGRFFAQKKIFAPPGYLPAPFHPLKKLRIPPGEFFGVSLRGNWRLLLWFIPLHLLAMFSEEMMWRGYLLPLQEALFGSWAWVLNGFLWAWLVHAVLKWHFVGMLPGMLVTPLVAQYTQSSWASLITHAIPNAFLWILLLLGVLNRKEKGDEG